MTRDAAGDTRDINKKHSSASGLNVVLVSLKIACVQLSHVVVVLALRKYFGDVIYFSFI